MSKYCFGIDVGGTTIKCGLFTVEGEVLDKWEIVTRSEDGGKNILPDIAAAVLGKLALEALDKKDCVGIGVGVPGPVRGGVVGVAVNLHWGRVDVASELEKLTGLPIAVGNDANIAALGEAWKGGAEGCDNVIMLTLGTGVGGGIIVDGKIVEGAHGAGGEIGHMPVDDTLTERCNCGKCGCLEQFASATGITRLGKRALEKVPEDEMTLLTESDLSAKSIFDAYKQDDPCAKRVVKKFAVKLGTAIAALSVVTDPDVIVIGGGVSKAGRPLIDAVAAEFRPRTFSSCKDTKIVLAKLGNDAGIYGAAKLVIK